MFDYNLKHDYSQIFTKNVIIFLKKIIPVFMLVLKE